MAGAPTLVEAAVAGVDALTNLAKLSAVVSSGRLEALLREALAEHQRRHAGHVVEEAGPSAPSDLAAAAVWAACAHLATHSFEDAYLALLYATDHLKAHRRRHW